MNKKYISLALAGIMMIAVVTVVVAQDSTSDDEFFGSGTTALVTDLEATGKTVDEKSGELLAAEAIKIGGWLTMEPMITVDADKIPELFSGEASATDTLDLSTTLFVDARPSKDIRVFVKGQADYPFSGITDFSIRELFTDLTLADSVYIRAGKQTINWGVGRYFSPANVINLGNKDPEDPDAELVGPVAVKLHVPSKSSNYYAYAILQDIETKGTIGIAAKGEWVLGNTEVGLGGVYRPEQPWAATATASGSLWGIDLYGEAVLKGNDDRIFIVADPSVPLGVSTLSKSNELEARATAGFSWSWSNETSAINLSLDGQYYWNGSGYADSSLFTENAAAISSLVASGTIGANDLYLRGRQYGAVSVGLSDIANSDIGVSLFWLGNIEDGSGKIMPTINYTGINKVKIAISYTQGYGTAGSEYSPDGAGRSISLSFALTNMTF